MLVREVLSKIVGFTILKNFVTLISNQFAYIKYNLIVAIFLQRLTKEAPSTSYSSGNKIFLDTLVVTICFLNLRTILYLPSNLVYQ